MLNGPTTSAIGLSTYSFFWQWHETAPRPLTLPGIVAKTASWGVDLLQLCDYPALDGTTPASRRPGRRRPRPRRRLRARHPRSRHRAPPALPPARRPSRRDPGPVDGQARGGRRRARAAGQGRPRLRRGRRDARPGDLRADPHPDPRRPGRADRLRILGIVLDPGNCVAALETPVRRSTSPHPSSSTCTSRTSRSAGMPAGSGSRFAGCPPRRGPPRLRLPRRPVRPDERGINQIIEHWLPWQGDSEATCRTGGRLDPAQPCPPAEKAGHHHEDTAETTRPHHRRHRRRRQDGDARLRQPRRAAPRRPLRRDLPRRPTAHHRRRAAR